MRLIYFSPVPWESFSQRPHKFVEWFNNRTGGAVLWLDPYPTRLPGLNDLRRLRLSPEAHQSVHLPNWLTVLKPKALPIEPIPGSGWLNKSLWKNTLNTIEEFADRSHPLIAVGKPSIFAIQVLEQFKQSTSLYDAMDDFPAFYSGLSRFAIRHREYTLSKNVDVVWASSSDLKAHWERHHDNVRLVHNGLDLSVIPQLDPRSTTSLKRVFGYVGTIGSWFDWDSLCALAKARPSDVIRLIGPVFEKPVGSLPNNVELLPACNHKAAILSMREFSVGLIPFKKNALTSSVDPIKYYEYLALGLPLISTNFGEMRFRSEERGVFISRCINDLPALAEAALQFKYDTEEICIFAQKNSWMVRFDSAKLFQ